MDIPKAEEKENELKRTFSKNETEECIEKEDKILLKEMTKKRKESKIDIEKKIEKAFNREMNEIIREEIYDRKDLLLLHAADNWNLLFKDISLRWTEVNENNVMMPVEIKRQGNFLVAFIIHWGDGKKDYSGLDESMKELINRCPKYKVSSLTGMFGPMNIIDRVGM